MELERYSIVLLRRGPRAGEYSDPELEQLQAQHLAHLDAMHARGVLAVAGPFRDQADETLRGLCVYRASLEESHELATQDPAVQAGRMSVDVFTWLVQRGALAFPLADALR